MAGSEILYPSGIQSNEMGGGAIDIDFHEILRFLRRRLPIVLGCIIVATAFAVILTTQLTKKYTATAQILINPPSKAPVDIDPMDQGMLVDSSFINSQEKILQSRRLLERLVTKLNLMDDPEFNPALRDKPDILATIARFSNPLNWIPTKGSGAASAPASEQERAERRMNAVVNTVQGSVTAARDGLSYIIQVSATSEDPQRAAELANTLVDLYFVDELEWRAETVRRQNKWLDEQLETLRGKLTASENALEQYRAENNLVDVSGESITDQQRERLNAQLVVARSDLATAEARARKVRGLQERGTPETAMEVLNSGVIAQLRAQQASLITQRANLASIYGERHPKMLNIKAELNDLNRQINIEINRIVANIDNEVDVAKHRVETLEQALRELNSRAAENEQAMIKMKELEREAFANQELYKNLLEGFKKTSVLSGQGTLQPIARQLSAASIPGAPSYPRKKLIVAVALFGGTALGLAIAFLAEALDDGITTSQEVESQLHVPHLASIPVLTKREYLSKRGDKRIHDFLLDKPLSEFTESFRHLRSGFALLNVDHPPKVVLVSSSLPSEGKTTVSICLARSAASAGLRTLIIDADLRNPSVSSRMKSHEIEMGLVEVLTNRCDIDDVLIKDSATPLHILPTVAMVSTSTDVLNSQAMSTLLDRARDNYDFIILDSAPTLLVADTANLARHVDACAFVIQWDETPKRAAANGIKKLRNTGVPYVGAVLSQVDVRRLKSYGQSDDAYYMSKYSVYYADS